MTMLAVLDRMANAVAAFAKKPSVEGLATIAKVAAGGDASPPTPEAMLAGVDDDTLIGLYAKAEQIKAEKALPYDYAARFVAVEIERRLHARRAERGNDESAIEMPHPLVDVILEPQFGPYRIDVDQARPVLAGLPDEQRAKLLKVIPARDVPEEIIPEQIIPAQTIPAHRVEEQIIVGPIASWKAIAAKYAGSDVGKVLAASFTRDRLSERVIIRPKKTTAPKRVGGSL